MEARKNVKKGRWRKKIKKYNRKERILKEWSEVWMKMKKILKRIKPERKEENKWMMNEKT